VKRLWIKPRYIAVASPLLLLDPCISALWSPPWAAISTLGPRAAGAYGGPRSPPEVPGAAAILRTFETFGFEWDGQVLWQGARTQAYAQAIERLRDAGLIFPALAAGARSPQTDCRG